MGTTAEQKFENFLDREPGKYSTALRFSWETHHYKLETY